ncbi:MAG: hypothetical protein AB7K09_06455 [Planctomycetota bacterium]
MSTRTAGSVRFRWCTPALIGCMLSASVVWLAVGASGCSSAPKTEATYANSNDDDAANNAKRARANVARNAGSAEMDAEGDIRNAGN